jgi:hypothetical protein
LDTDVAKASSSKTATNKTSKSSSAKDSDASTTAQPTTSLTSTGTPSLDARARFGANIFLLSGMELSHVVTTLELECPNVLEPWGEQKLEINVDEIPPKVFATLNAYVTTKVGTKRAPDSPGDDDVHSSKKKKRKTM